MVFFVVSYFRDFVIEKIFIFSGLVLGDKPVMAH